MTDQRLIEYLVENRQHRISSELAFWFKTCNRFKEFTYNYRDKIRKKIRDARTDEDLYDVMYELEVPYLMLLDKRFEVVYERFGTGKVRAPDFFVIFEQSTSFNVEVKRIREATLMTRLMKWYGEVKNRIRKVPSGIKLSILFNKLDYDTDQANDLLDKLECSKDEIISYIKETIQAKKDEIPIDIQIEYAIPGFEGDITFTLCRPLHKSNNKKTFFEGGMLPVFFTYKELNKFGDAILEKMGQMKPGMINLLVLRSTSSTHEEEDLKDALMSIRQYLNNNDENFFTKKGFNNKQDFLNQLKHLSGILFRSMWSSNTRHRNLLLPNDNADKQISKIIQEYLKRMDNLHLNMSS